MSFMNIFTGIIRFIYNALKPSKAETLADYNNGQKQDYRRYDNIAQKYFST